MIHYDAFGPTREWLREMLAIESEAALEPLGAGPLLPEADSFPSPIAYAGDAGGDSANGAGAQVTSTNPRSTPCASGRDFLEVA